MSALLALMLAAGLPAADAEAAEITVIGIKMRQGRLKYNYAADGTLSCRIIKSTRDAEVDAIGCAAIRHCDAALADQRAPIFASATPARDRKRLQAAFQTGPMQQCYLQRRDELKAALARRRAGLAPS